MKARWLFSVGMLVAVTWSAYAADPELEEFYPSKPGTKWTYVVKDQTDKFVLVAAREDKVGEQPCIKFEGKIKTEIVSTEHVAILKDGVYRFKINEKMIGPPVNFFKLPAKKGDKWEQKFEVDKKQAAVKFSTDVEEVEVPAGKYKDAYVVRGEVLENNITVKTTVWYVPKVGMVKQVIEYGKDATVLELEKMEVEEKKK